MNNTKKEELQNLYCFLKHKTDITNCVPRLYSSTEFNRVMQKYYSKPFLIYNHEDYLSAMKMYEEKKLKHREAIYSILESKNFTLAERLTFKNDNKLL